MPLRDRIADIRVAAMILTRIPAGRQVLGPDATLGRAVWAYPVMGAVAGGLAAGAYGLGMTAGFSRSIAAACALVAGVLITGALHEDGLADFADGLGGGRDRAAKLAIMRDSRIGTYGVVALVLAFFLRWAAIPALGDTGFVLRAWIAAGALSRAAIALLLWRLPAARADGLGASAAAPPGWSVAGALLIGLAIAWGALGLASLPLIGATLVTTVIVGALAWRHLGGHTGDVLGACALSSECACLMIAGVGWL